MLTIPHTEQHIISRINHGPRAHTNFVVVHITDGSTMDGALSWWAQDGHEADGAHIIVDNHHAMQTADLRAKCWHAGAANDESPGIEHVGVHGADRLWWLRNDVMLHLSANRCAWIHHEFGLGRPQWLKTIFPHSYGGAAWGGHPLCPGHGFPHDVYERLANHAYMDHWGR